MEDARKKFAERLKAALEQAGYAAKPAVLEREFNLRYWGKPVTLHGVRRWLRGESIPTEDKMLVLAQWLNQDPSALLFGTEVSRQITERNLLLDRVFIQERETIEAFLGLSAQRRKLLREVIQTFAQVEKLPLAVAAQPLAITPSAITPVPEAVDVQPSPVDPLAAPTEEETPLPAVE